MRLDSESKGVCEEAALTAASATVMCWFFKVKTHFELCGNAVPACFLHVNVRLTDDSTLTTGVYSIQSKCKE